MGISSPREEFLMSQKRCKGFKVCLTFLGLRLKLNVYFITTDYPPKFIKNFVRDSVVIIYLVCT